MATGAVLWEIRPGTGFDTGGLVKAITVERLKNDLSITGLPNGQITAPMGMYPGRGGGTARAVDTTETEGHAS